MTKLLIFFTFLLIPITTSCQRPPLPPPIVLFDLGHNQQFLINHETAKDLSGLANIFTRQGFTVKSSDTLFNKALLHNVSTLVISGPLTEISPQEVVVLRHFINKGGQLAVMLHIDFPVDKLLRSLGVAISNNVIHEQENTFNPHNDTDFFITDLAPHPLTKGLKQINLYGAWALNTQMAANIIAKTSPLAWIDINHNKKLDKADAVQSFSAVVTGQIGRGQFIIFADDAIFQNRFLVGPNMTLGINLVKWLKEGSYYPHD